MQEYIFEHFNNEGHTGFLERKKKKLLETHFKDHGTLCRSTLHDVPKCLSCHKAIVVITGGNNIVFVIAYILRSSCFCEI